MKYILDGKAMKDADRYTIEETGMPSLVLMERAALKTLEVMEQEELDLSNVLIVCGSGNNGGDGFAVARLLLQRGKTVTVVLAGNPDHCTEETKTQRKIFENCGGITMREIPKGDYTAIVDALFGIGLSREVSGHYAQILKKLNSMSGKKVAVDIPSGVSAASGEILGTAFRADMTVTFAYQKAGMVLYPGASFAGKVFVADIGIYLNEQVCGQRYVTYEKEDIERFRPKRKPDSNKGTYGKILMITGGSGMSGASYLSAKAAYRTGAGLVQIFTSEANRIILQSTLPEAIVSVYTDETDAALLLKEKLEWADIICLGCGIGTSETARKITDTVFGYLSEQPKNCVVDADGLNLIASMEEEKKERYLRGAGKCLIFTPHVKELSRLLSKTVEETKKNRISLAQQYSENYNIVLAAKDARTVVTGKGLFPYLNMSGNAAMAKAGSGDVLAGIITGLLALGMDRYEAASLGVCIHGFAGDAARETYGEHGVMAEDIIEMAASLSGEVNWKGTKQR
ncbi:hypothetical protein B5F13_04595 [Drancourtella sp. An177]|nr:hypothetical protein B5F13_04595 [Drancourtella sp. An177]